MEKDNKDMASLESATPLNSALFLSAFLDELYRCGVRDVVISPGSRSTPLSMLAYESAMRVFVDIDERGAAFFALGMAKAGGRPVALVCTSGTAVANYYPAILEAEASRIPLLVLTSDRPSLEQNLGSPQTCDQIKIFGGHVRHFQQMPTPGRNPSEIAFARQMALAAFSKAVGLYASANEAGQPWYGCISNAGPVHLNFPFNEPLMPDLKAEDLFSVGRSLVAEDEELSPLISACVMPNKATIARLMRILAGKRTIVLCGEGSFVAREEAEDLLSWAHTYQIPLLADPLSNLRSFDSPLVIDNYDKIFGSSNPIDFEAVIRFGRYPVSKSCFSKFIARKHVQIVVDAFETRDFKAATDLFVLSTPASFVKAFLKYAPQLESAAHGTATATNALSQQQKEQDRSIQRTYTETWISRNQTEARRIAKVREIDRGFEGAFVYQLVELVPEGSCLFVGNSLSVRLLDTFYLKANKRLDVYCNRGLSGIDGTTSSALGAAQAYEQTTLLLGDLAFLHDLNALALQQELLLDSTGKEIPKVVIIVLNNKGGAIFDTLPQRSSEPYFARLFKTAPHMRLADIAAGFDIPFMSVETVSDFASSYRAFAGQPGLHLIEVIIEPGKIRDYYANFLS